MVLLADFRTLLLSPIAFYARYYTFNDRDKPKGVPKRVTKMVGRC